MPPVGLALCMPAGVWPRSPSMTPPRRCVWTVAKPATRLPAVGPAAGHTVAIGVGTVAAHATTHPATHATTHPATHATTHATTVPRQSKRARCAKPGDAPRPETHGPRPSRSICIVLPLGISVDALHSGGIYHYDR